MEAVLYNQKGAEAGKVKLPEELFGLPWNDELVHQVVVGIEKNMRQGSTHTKDRSEVRGGGKKPWRQKGTGQARHGSIRSPLWRGGGITFGPRNEKDFSVSTNKKMRSKAFLTVLSQRARDNNIAFLEAFSLEVPSTKEASALMQKVCDTLSSKKDPKNECLVVLNVSNPTTQKSFQNIQGVSTVTVDTLNTRDVLIAKKILFINPDEALASIQARSTILKK